MKKLYEAADLIEARLLHDQLNNAGYEVVLQGELLSGALGELPLNTYPTLWVRDESRYDAARELIKQLLIQPENNERWQCEQCGECHSAAFSQCWRCGAERSD